MADFDCDVFFPKFDRSVFKKQRRWDYSLLPEYIKKSTDKYSIWYCTVIVDFSSTSFPGVPDGIHEENGITFRFQVFKKEAQD